MMNKKCQISLCGAAVLFLNAGFSGSSFAAREEASPRESALAQLARSVEMIQPKNVELAVAFTRSKFPVPAKAESALKKLSEDAELLRKALEKEPDEATLRQVNRYNRICSQAYEQIRNIEQALSSAQDIQNSYPLCLDSEYYMAYITLRKEAIENAVEALSQIVNGQYYEDAQREARSRSHELDYALRRILNLLQAQREITQNPAQKRHSNYNLPQDNPLVKEYLTFSEQLMKVYQKQLEDIKVGMKGENAGQLESAYHCWHEILRKEAELLVTAKDCEALKASDAFNAYVGAVRKCQDSQKKHINSLLAKKPGEPDDSTSTGEELRKSEQECQASRKALSFAQTALQINEKVKSLAKACPQLSKIEFEPRAAELAKAMKETDAAYTKAVIEQRRVLIVETEAKAEFLQMKLRALMEEAEQETRFYNSLSDIGGYDKLDKDAKKKVDAALVELRQQRMNLQKFRESQAELNGRIKLLELKVDLMGDKENSLESNYEEAVENLDELIRRVGDHSRAEKNKDFEDAEKIPLVAPIDNIQIK